MNLGENRIEMQIPRSAWVPRDLRVSRIPKPFLIEFITASRDICRLQTLPALGHLVGYLLALFEGLKSAACYPRVVHEHVFATIFWRDEAKALLVVEPLDRSLGHVLKDPAFLSVRFLCKGQRPILMLPGSAPAALKSVATAASIIVEEQEELGALEKTL